MALSIKCAINPVPWFVNSDGTWNLDRATVEGALAGSSAAGFTAVHAEITPDMTDDDYAEALTRHTLRAAPGYFGPAFHDADAFPDILERAKKHGAQQAALGLTETFIASGLVDERRARPAIGAHFDADLLKGLIERMGIAAEAMVREGVLPCLHSHVASRVETEQEIRAVLDGLPADVVAFGPDTGHMLWAGMDPMTVIADYADRVKAFHIKDVHADRAEQAQKDGLTYIQATRKAHVWTEPGRGDVDFDGVFSILPDDYEGWFVIEVDVPDLPNREESTAAAAQWIHSLPSLHSIAWKVGGTVSHA